MEHEQANLEFKRQYIEDIKFTVVAFANTEGGRLLVGVEDDGSVCGVSDPDETMLRIMNMVRDAIRPDITLFTRCRYEWSERCGVDCSAWDVAPVLSFRKRHSAGGRLCEARGGFGSGLGNGHFKHDFGNIWGLL